jgi:hypothetical protein
MSLSGLIGSRRAPRITGLVLIVAGLLVLSGCWLYSVEPLYEEHLTHPDPDLSFDSNLVGSCGEIDDNCLWILTITADQQVYELTMAPAPECKSKEKATKYEGHLVKLANRRVLDVTPKSDDVCDLCLPLHSFLLVSQENDGLAFVPVQRDWMFRALTEKRVVLAHLQSGNSYDIVVLTASSKDLKEFRAQIRRRQGSV